MNVQIASMIEIEVEMDIDVLAAEGAGATVSHNVVAFSYLLKLAAHLENSRLIIFK